MSNLQAILGQDLDAGKNLDVLFQSDDAKDILIVGSSGYGKTCEGKIICRQFASQGAKVAVFDLHNSFGKAGIPLEKGGELGIPALEYDVSKEGIPYKWAMESAFSESESQKMAGNFSDFLCASMEKIGDLEREALLTSASTVLNRYRNSPSVDILRLIVENLKSLQERPARSVATRIMEISRSLKIVNKEFPFEEGKITVIRLGGLSDAMQIIAAKMMIMSLWINRPAIDDDNAKDLFIWCDEFQNYVSKNTDCLLRILNEGRKFHEHLILSTQSLSVKLNKDWKTAITSMDIKIAFRPNDQENKRVAALIDPNEVIRTASMLHELEVGQFMTAKSKNKIFWNGSPIMDAIVCKYSIEDENCHKVSNHVEQSA